MDIIVAARFFKISTIYKNRFIAIIGFMDITVVICTYNRPERLAGALASCLEQETLPCRIVLVDDGDLTGDFVVFWSGLASEKGVELEYFHKPADCRGLTISRNIGLRLAVGEIVQFLDDDAELPSDGLTKVSAVFEADKTKRIAGVDLPIIEQARKNRGRRVIDACYRFGGLWTLGRRFVGRSQQGGRLAWFDDLEIVRFLQGGSMAIRREYLERVGGFDETLTGSAMGEDKEISIKLAKIGLLARIARTGVIHHSEPGSRPDAKRLGFETLYNYLCINTKQGPLGVGEWLLIIYNLAMLLMTEVLFIVLGDRRQHCGQITGMLSGIRKFAETLCRKNNQASCS
jgi:GT2 family glycosyltransferase